MLTNILWGAGLVIFLWLMHLVNNKRKHKPAYKQTNENKELETEVARQRENSRRGFGGGAGM
ncbi:hypothetical protein [Salsuginibacillus kocurii]|uniref:hypothetical protein n=1 Tax=Salsuginibacillus kocurii TaxID=427078 RepID=UPI00037F5425|nr:hypothetical protein [Salsuginibacillus kocurii]